MGAIGGLVGLGGGANGSGFAGPSAANLVNPTSADQLSTAYTNNQNSMASQQALLQALQNQNGLANQSNVYGQLQGVAAGTGPNPAQAQLAQATGANVANQAALAAGQRGAGANVGLIARQAGQTGAAAQQESAGQAATLQAQQSLNAISAAGNMANTQAANQIGQTNANVSAQQAEQQALLNAQAQYNAAQVGMQSNINNVNGQLANTNMQGQQALIGGVMSGFGATSAAGSAAALAKGGDVRKMADGGDAFSSGPSSKFGQFLVSNSSAPQIQNTNTPSFGSDAGAAALQGGAKADISKLKPGQGTATAPGTGIAPQNTATPDSAVANVYSKPGGENMQARGGAIRDFRVGGKVKASSLKEKAKASGNSYSNDKIPAVLSEHEIVLPRSVTLSKDPVGDSAKFVQAVIAKRKVRR